MSTWIFQGNPESFDIDGYLAATEVVLWTVRQRHLASRMSPGDRVFFWRSGGDQPKRAGVMAAGWIDSTPADQPLDAAAQPFARDPSFDAGTQLRVPIRIERVADSKQLIRREWLKDDPVLADLRILHLAPETNFLLSDAHAERLEALWLKTGRLWSDDESLAGIWAYSKTMGGEISRLPDTPVSDVALLIGRAVSGVYNKVMNFRAIDPTDARDGLSGGSETDRRVWDKYFIEGKLDRARIDAAYDQTWFGIVHEPSGASATPAAVAKTPMASEAQGYEPNPLIKKKVEDCAVARAIAHYEGRGFKVENVGHRECYDLVCTRNGEAPVRVEVKGTRGGGAVVIVTANEVQNAREAKDYKVDLYVVSGISIAVADGQVSASGGQSRLLEGWMAEDDSLTATQYRYRLPS